MPRPIKHTIDYFPHIVIPGKTLLIIENEFGNDGYAFWFKLLELLCCSDGQVYDYNNTPEWRFMLAKTHVSEDMANRLLASLAELGAIDKDLYERKIIWVQKLVDNLELVYSRRSVGKPQKPNIYQQKLPLNDVIANNNPTSEGVSADKSTQTKLNNTKLNNTKDNGHSDESLENSVSLEDLVKIGKSTKKNPPEWMTWRKQLFAQLKERRGYDITKGQRAGEAKQMGELFQMGYKPEQIMIAYDKMKLDKYWDDKVLTLMSVAKQIGEVLKNGTHKPSVSKDPYSTDELKASVGRHLNA